MAEMTVFRDLGEIYTCTEYLLFLYYHLQKLRSLYETDLPSFGYGVQQISSNLVFSSALS